MNEIIMKINVKLQKLEALQMRGTLCHCEHKGVIFDLVCWSREGFLQKRTIDFRSRRGGGANQVVKRGKNISYRWKSIGKD